MHERVRELKPLGVGINLLPHAVRELTELGLGDQVAAIGVRPVACRTPTASASPSGASHEVSTRATGGRSSRCTGRFQCCSRARSRPASASGAIRLGQRFDGVEHRGATEIAQFTDAAGRGQRSRPTWSSAPTASTPHCGAQWYPDEGAPPWNGLVLWRGTAIVPQFLDGRTMIMAGDGEQKFVAYPLVVPGTDWGRRRINFIAERRAPEGVGETADWNRPVDAAPIIGLFADWRFDWLDVPGVIAAADEILEYPMVDREPLPRWTFGRTTLIGDAAHALYPNGSNGASQAIIDARTLAYELATRPTVDDALEAYEAERRPATARLHEMTRRLGPERVMQLAYDRAPDGFDDIDDVIPLAEREQIAADYKLAAGFHPERLNERASLTPPAASVTRSSSIASRRRVVATTWSPTTVFTIRGP